MNINLLQLFYYVFVINNNKYVIFVINSYKYVISYEYSYTFLYKYKKHQTKYNLSIELNLSSIYNLHFNT